MSRRKQSGSSSKTSKRASQWQPVHPDAAGIDVGAREHFVAVPPDRDVRPVRRFETFTADLHRLADWLGECGIKTVALESTGVYWIPLFEILDRRGFDVLLVDARRLKSVPGRKTDALDCQWLQQLHSYGLLAGAFRPDDATCVLRSYLRQRAMLIEHASHHIQHMHKALEQMNVKLNNVLSDITGQTGMAIIEAILAGERDPVALARFRDWRCKHSEEMIAKALHGNWREDHLFELQQAVELYRIYRSKLVECDERIESYLARFEDKSGGRPLPPKRSKPNPNAPRFDARTLLYRMTGVDLTRIDGLDANTVLKVISEIGTDITRWPTARHFASWLCLCPGNHKTGGRQKSGKTRRSANRAAAALRIAAQSLQRSQTALGAYYRRMKARLGPPQAITATAHKLARLIYHMLRYGIEYVDIGQAAYERQYQDRILKNLHRRAAQFGHILIPINPLPPTPQTS
jgi:transposase